MSNLELSLRYKFRTKTPIVKPPRPMARARTRARPIRRHRAKPNAKHSHRRLSSQV